MNKEQIPPSRNAEWWNEGCQAGGLGTCDWMEETSQLYMVTLLLKE